MAANKGMEQEYVGQEEYMGPEEAANGEPEAAGPFREQVGAKIEVPPEMQEAYERIILAGMKVMYSEETGRMAMDSLQGEGPIEQRLAKGICDLMVLLWQESNQSMPPQLIIPAAVELLSDAADFMNESGMEQVDMPQLGEAMRLMVGMILERFGVTPESVQQGAAEEGVMPQQGAGQVPGGGQSPTQGGGIISSRMMGA
jgi:hypothetical protein